ncbi:hypothetical protein TIFTF001_020074 [Ficus carica]|uniref:Uncharacterized protein n=1 Tax=Ficus carica TaxID=3494 RepID=A0AA88AXI1_FICCA|nr:hypothetical protein TIFTF001_020074 [Ficus carica]
MKFWVETSSHLSSISSSPLVSSIVTLYALILLYVPHQFLRILFSPVPIITGILLFSLLRLGATQKCDDETKKSGEEEEALRVLETEPEQSREESKEIATSSEPDQQITDNWPEEDHNWVDDDSETDSEPETGFGPDTRFEDSFVGWNLRAPLEVIYEEDEEEDRTVNSSVKEEEEITKEVVGIERYASLSRYYPESEESENSDDEEDGEFPATGFWDSPESLGFRWEEEDREGLIEIALDGNKKNDKRGGLDYLHVEEDNLIEIDLSLPRNDSPPATQVLLT